MNGGLVDGLRGQFTDTTTIVLYCRLLAIDHLIVNRTNAAEKTLTRE
jgi:hypothetical protein